MRGSHDSVLARSRARPSPLFGQYAPTTKTFGSSAHTTRPSPSNSSISNGSCHGGRVGSRLRNIAVPEYPSRDVAQFHVLCGYSANTLASISGTFFSCSLVSCSSTTSASSLAATWSRISGSLSRSARIELTFHESTVSLAGWSARSSLGARGGSGGSVTSHLIRGGGLGFGGLGFGGFLFDADADAGARAGDRDDAVIPRRSPGALARSTRSAFLPPTR
mmetsp:Transcript_8237/g.32493  ORF Transcript_8237/g.32493 Transcript_8237/m.32493 type:complete len:220 (-) Transcript_8237:205-864(-)